MNFPQTVDELIHWDVSTGHDSFGVYTIITGFEGTGACFWCGADLDGERRRFCGHRSGHWTLYNDYFFWGFARYECLRRYGWHCANCGSAYKPEVHHIIPLEGAERAYSPYNIPWNLMCLCHEHHQLIHAVLRQPKELLATPDLFDLALARGQAVFEPLRELASLIPASLDKLYLLQ